MTRIEKLVDVALALRLVPENNKYDTRQICGVASLLVEECERLTDATMTRDVGGEAMPGGRFGLWPSPGAATKWRDA